jgi:AraC-like DNA-binding protein/TM2 domain-containing membrane protein YozV
MNVLILIGAFQACFFTILVLSKQRKTIADKILATWLSIFTIHLAFVYYSFLCGYEFYIEYGHLYSGLLVTYYSLMYVYTESLISEDNKFKSKWLIHIIPTVIAYICIIPLARLPYKEKINLITHLTTNFYAVFVFVITISFTTIYLIAILRLLRKHKISIRKVFSYEDNISLNWLRILTILLVFLWIGISILVINLYRYETSALAMQPRDHVTMDMQGHIAFVIFIFFLGFFGIRQQAIYANPLKESNVAPKTKLLSSRYEKSGLKKEDSAIHLNQLLKYMEVEKPYLNEKLTLKEVAETLNISTNHLSQVINENLEKNFFDFVNRYRVDLAKQKLRDHSNKNYTLLSIAYDCGFSSKSSFNAIFKRFEGTTPSEFQKNK